MKITLQLQEPYVEYWSEEFNANPCVGDLLRIRRPEYEGWAKVKTRIFKSPEIVGMTELWPLTIILVAISDEDIYKEL